MPKKSDGASPVLGPPSVIDSEIPMSLQTKSITFEDYLLMPEIDRPYEIIEGEPRMTPAPTPDHQWIAITLR